ncbi:MAG: hypothetical protein HY901_08855 [Deltaproteobacteria bacterium]|nr:hypothetical protein [Deltaproteobacteria bacterium]
MGLRNSWIVPLLSASALSFVYCSEDGGKPVGGRDSGSAAVECASGDDCAAGDCLDGLCVWCTDTSCATGAYCSNNGKCVLCDGGCAVDASEPVDAGKSCSTRADCSGYACHAGICGPQDPSGVCATGDDCNSGFNCSQGLCVAGCSTKADCAGSPAGPRCDVATGSCGPCAEAADCDPATQNCVSSACVEAVLCPAGDRGPCGSMACVDKVCRPCTSATDCGPGFDCEAGACEGRAACTEDSQCHVLSPGHWCETASGLCKWGCVTGTSPDCGQNCCTAPLACNDTSHECEAVPCNNCGGTCLPNQTCDEASCSCVTGEKCDGSCGCSAGKSCDCGMTCFPMACGTGAFTCK